jgi:hypothetical protein
MCADEQQMYADVQMLADVCRCAADVRKHLQMGADVQQMCADVQ